ncbi:MAG: CAP domain-containing protein [Candidatus Microgenomates bacterium]
MLGFIHKAFPEVLGYAANISPSEVISLTNQERVENGLAPLNANSTLSQAAVAKGNDMLAKGYWAHFAPDGTSPWSFFLKFGYKYEYAGENLARDFPDAASAVTAWMNSPSHRENILNPNYQDIGIGVVEGNLAGVDTTIIVQFFGTPLGSQASVPVVQAKEETTVLGAKPTYVPSPTATPGAAVVYEATSAAIVSFISPFTSTKSISLLVTGILILVLSADLIIVRRKRIARIGGRTLAHLAFFGMILAVILILKAGQVI